MPPSMVSHHPWLSTFHAFRLFLVLRVHAFVKCQQLVRGFARDLRNAVNNVTIRGRNTGPDLSCNHWKALASLRRRLSTTARRSAIAICLGEVAAWAVFGARPAKRDLLRSLFFICNLRRFRPARRKLPQHHPR